MPEIIGRRARSSPHMDAETEILSRLGRMEGLLAGVKESLDRLCAVIDGHDERLRVIELAQAAGEGSDAAGRRWAKALGVAILAGGGWAVGWASRWAVAIMGPHH
ncbi:MAG TPA: hypothetical protein VGR91_17270 [Stellaceae bacterium]|nr:hypothetical protein [Stellaceae bacterium]